MTFYPQYIVLTLVRVAERNPRDPKRANATFVNPPVQQLMVMPMLLSREQHGLRAETEIGGKLLTFSEYFDDVVNAIADAGMGELVVARPARRDLVDEAAKESPLHKLAQEMRDGTAKFVSPTMAEKAAAAERQAEGAKHQGEPVEPFGDPDPLRWDDFADMAKIVHAVEAGAPKREHALGDLRITRYDEDGVWIEVLAHDEFNNVEGEKPIYEWKRAGVPSELMPIYPTREAAREAVKLAGYIRRLIEE